MAGNLWACEQRETTIITWGFVDFPCTAGCGWRDLNPRHSVPKTDALSAELQPRVNFLLLIFPFRFDLTFESVPVTETTLSVARSIQNYSNFAYEFGPV